LLFCFWTGHIVFAHHHPLQWHRIAMKQSPATTVNGSAAINGRCLSLFQEAAQSLPPALEAITHPLAKPISRPC